MFYIYICYFAFLYIIYYIIVFYFSPNAILFKTLTLKDRTVGVTLKDRTVCVSFIHQKLKINIFKASHY